MGTKYIDAQRQALGDLEYHALDGFTAPPPNLHQTLTNRHSVCRANSAVSGLAKLAPEEHFCEYVRVRDGIAKTASGGSRGLLLAKSGTSSTRGTMPRSSSVAEVSK
jgi:hypothetical protein